MRSLMWVLTLAVALLVPGLSVAQTSDAEAVPPGCEREYDAVFWGGIEQLVLAQALAAERSPCVEYFLTIPPRTDRTMLPAAARFNEVRALGIHPVADIRWTSPTGWRAWVIADPERTFYEAGVLARQRMAERGLDVEAGETWAFNELTTEVLEGVPGARAEVLEFIRGLYDGAPGMPKARGIVFNVFVDSTSDPAEVAAYKASLRSWLLDEAFWTELDRYVDVFANEVYASSLAWGVSGAPLGQRAKRLNDYFQHMAILAEAGQKSIEAARSFLHRTYLPLANAAWPHPFVGDTHLLSAEQMKHFVSTQVYALRTFAEDHPKTVPQGLIGFGWAPITGEDPVLVAGRVQIAARLAAAIRAATDELPTEPKDACGPPGDRLWCEGELEGAWFNTAWRIFGDWE